jgi:HEAT repeat protein
MKPFKKSFLTLGIAATLFSSIGCAANNDYQQLASNKEFASNETGVSNIYQAGQHAMDNGDWKKAIKHFNEMIKDGNNYVDAALYWKAYSEFRAGRKSKAIRSLNTLFKNHKSSQWISQAKSLQAEIKGVDEISDDELKEYALNSLLHVSPERAMPLLKKTLGSENSKDVKEMALFVLSQLGTEEARQIIESTAKDNTAPELQKNAIQMLAISGDKKSLLILGNLYNKITNVDVREDILSGFMISGDKAQLLQLAKTEQNVDLRAKAVEMLGSMRAQKNNSSAIREQAIFWLSQTDEKNSKEIAKLIMHLMADEKNIDVRLHSIFALSQIKNGDGLEYLEKLITTSKDKKIRQQALFWLAESDEERAMPILESILGG